MDANLTTEQAIHYLTGARLIANNFFKISFFFVFWGQIFVFILSLYFYRWYHSFGVLIWSAFLVPYLFSALMYSANWNKLFKYFFEMSEMKLKLKREELSENELQFSLINAFLEIMPSLKVTFTSRTPNGGVYD